MHFFHENFKRNLARLSRILARGGPSAILSLVCSLVVCAIVLIVVAVIGAAGFAWAEGFVQVMALSLAGFVLFAGAVMACYRPVPVGRPLPVQWRRGGAALWLNFAYNSRGYWREILAGNVWYVSRSAAAFVISSVLYATGYIFLWRILNVWVVLPLAVGSTIVTLCVLLTFYSKPRQERRWG